MPSENHPLDQTLALQPTDKQGHYQARITPAYANMVGPYGGAIAAVLLKAIIQHPDAKGEPVSLTVNFAAPIADEDFQVAALLKRNNRSTQHWSLELSQQGEVVVTATGMFAIQRDSWSDTEASVPDVRAAESLQPMPTAGMPAWVANYDMRMLKGPVTMQPEHQTVDSTTQLWISDKPARPLDYLSLLAMSDCFFPRIFVRRQQMVPAGTVTLTTYFHADKAALDRQGDKPLLAQARANRFHNGFFDQDALLWGGDGELLASSHQLVYFKG